MKRIPVRTQQRSYEVLVQPGVIRSIGAILREFLPETTRVFLISSETILQKWGDAIHAGLAQGNVKSSVISMPDGETAKRLSAVEKLAKSLVEEGADRQSVVVAFGGGVVGDVAGFLASIYMRGIPVVQVPTTLVAQVDSAIGGKTGVNLNAGKNLIGTFHQPVLVVIDPEMLTTLPEREFRSGLFEAMKYGVIRNPEIFELMEREQEALLRQDIDILKKLIVDCVQVKAEVVSADEREGGKRRILNFGHTVGHALESATRYKVFLHGEAVGWGMIAAALIGREVGVTDAKSASRIASLVTAYGSLPRVEVSGRRVLKLIQSDKKTVSGVAHFVLAKKIGEVEVVKDVPKSTVSQAVDEISRMSIA